MREDNKDLPDWDKGIGGRISMYTIAIAFPKLSARSVLIDEEEIKLYARRSDRYLAITSLTLSLIWFIYMILIYFFIV